MLEKLGFEYKEQLFEYSVNGYENFECNDLTYSDEKTEIVRIKCEDMKLIRALVSGIDEMYSPLVNAARKILEHKNK